MLASKVFITLFCFASIALGYLVAHFWFAKVSDPFFKRQDGDKKSLSFKLLFELSSFTVLLTVIWLLIFGGSFVIYTALGDETPREGSS